MAECLKSVLELVELLLKSVLVSEVGVELYSKTIQYFVPEESVNYTINKHTIDRFKQLCQKRGWIMSIVIENNIKRLLEGV